MTRWFSLGLLLSVIIMTVLFYRIVAGFLIPLFLAVILVIMFRPLHKWVLTKWKGREHLAAAITTTVIAGVVLLPILLIMTLSAMEARTLLSQLETKEIAEQLNKFRMKWGLDFDFAKEMRYLETSFDTLSENAKQGATDDGDPQAVARIIEVTDQLNAKLKDRDQTAAALSPFRDALVSLHDLSDNPRRAGTLDYQTQLVDTVEALHRLKVELGHGEFRTWLKEIANPSPDELDKVYEWFFRGAPGVLRSLGGATTNITGDFLLGLGVMIFAVYFFLADGRAMTEGLMRLSPLDDQQERELLEEFDRVTRAVVIATLLSAVVQGLLAGLGFWISGVQAVFLLTLTTIVFALVPFVGAATVWVPVSLWLYFHDGRPMAAIALAVYGAIFVSMSDNVVKPLVLHGQSNLHPLFALLSVLGGVQAVGPIGILVGPMIVVFLQTLLKILQRELTTFDQVSPPVPAVAEGTVGPNKTDKIDRTDAKDERNTAGK